MYRIKGPTKYAYPHKIDPSRFIHYLRCIGSASLTWGHSTQLKKNRWTIPPRVDAPFSPLPGTKLKK
jgi:hypothetical protein